MDCVRCGHRLPPEQAARGRTWHKDTPCPPCSDEWCSHQSHLDIRTMENYIKEKKIAVVGRK